MCRTSAFDVTAQYTPESNIPQGVDRTLGRFTVKPPSGLGAADGKLKLKMKLRLNLNGCVGLEDVQNAVEEEYEDKVPRAAKVRCTCAVLVCLAISALGLRAPVGSCKRLV